MRHHLLYADVLSFFVTRKSQNIRKIVKIVNVEEENLYMFWTLWTILMKLLENMWLMMTLEIAKKTTTGLQPLNSCKYIFRKIAGSQIGFSA